MKKRRPLRRQIFVLTPEEKKAVWCVLAALFLGVGTIHYRSTHPRPPPPPTAKEQREARMAERSKRAEAARLERQSRTQNQAANN